MWEEGQEHVFEWRAEDGRSEAAKIGCSVRSRSHYVGGIWRPATTEKKKVGEHIVVEISVEGVGVSLLCSRKRSSNSDLLVLLEPSMLQAVFDYLQEDCGSCKAKRAYNKTGNYRAEAAADTSDEDWMHLPCVKKVSNRCLQTTWKYCLLHWQCTQSIGPRSCNNISSLAHLCLLELFLSSVNCVLCLAY